MLVTVQELADYTGLSAVTINNRIRRGIVKKNSDGLIDRDEAVKAIIDAMANPKEYGETRVKLPDSKVRMSTFLAVESVKEREKVSFGRAIELLLLESPTFLQTFKKVG